MISKTFVAKNNGVDYLFYEDGRKSTFSEIGEEYNGFRPVRRENKWSFFDIRNRKLMWEFAKGYAFTDGRRLYRKLNDNCHVIKTAEGKLKLCFYDPEGHHTHTKPQSFNTIYEDGRYIFGHQGALWYVYYVDSTKLPVLVGVYTQQPVRHSENGSFLITKTMDGSICLIKGGKEITNSNWGLNFRFKDSYIFNQNNNSDYWTVYDRYGMQLPIELMNLTIDENFIMRADTCNHKSAVIGISDIRKQIDALKEVSISLYEKSPSVKTPQEFSVVYQELKPKIDLETENSNHITCNNQSKGEYISSPDNAESKAKSTIERIQENNIVPSFIKYFTTSDAKIIIENERTLRYTKKNKDLSSDDYILWLFSKRTIIITKVTHYKTLEVCYYKELSEQIDLIYNSFTEVNFKLIDEADLFSHILSFKNMKHVSVTKDIQSKPQTPVKSTIKSCTGVAETSILKNVGITELPWNDVLNKMTDKERFAFMMEYFNGISFDGLNSMESFERCRSRFLGIKNDDLIKVNTRVGRRSEKQENKPTPSILNVEHNKSDETKSYPKHIDYNFRRYSVGDTIMLNRRSDRSIFLVKDCSSVFVVSERNLNGTYRIEGLGGRVQIFTPYNENTALRNRKAPIAIVCRIDHDKFKILDIVRYTGHNIVRYNNGDERIYFNLQRV